MDLIVFGDDWQAHPSTTQHLINHLPETDRIIWCNSIGMRAPTLTLYDIKRLYSKARSVMTPTKKGKHDTPDGRLAALIQPRVLPFHKNAWVKLWNKRSLSRMLQQLKEQYQLNDPVVLTSNPVVTDYLPDWLSDKVHYLRLDDYALFGGVDRSLAIASEQQTLSRAKHVFYTARELAPANSCISSSYLPQGVNVTNFQVNPVPGGTKTLGYFGLIEQSRFDFDLIYRVASKHPDWIFEFMGDVTYCPENLKACQNIIFKEKVAFSDLSNATKHWHAAWIPYKVNALTKSINPLKVREYLAMGLPVISSAMPEVMAIDADVKIYRSHHDFTAYLNEILATESNQARTERACTITAHSWDARCQQLRAVLTA